MKSPIFPALLAAVLIVAGCVPSGPIGARPELADVAYGGEGRDEVSFEFTIRDMDLSEAGVRVEYSFDSIEWHPASIVNATPGSVNANSVKGIRSSDWKSGTLAWDTREDGVGLTGPVTVQVAFTPFDEDADGDALEIPITVNNCHPKMELSAAAVSFGPWYQGSTAPATQQVEVRNVGDVGSTLSWTALVVYEAGDGWLAVNPAGGETGAGTPASLALSVDTDGIAPGAYSATVTFSAPAADDAPQTLAVSFEVLESQPALSVTPSTLSFLAFVGGEDPAVKSILIANVGTPGSSFNWSLGISYSEGAGWLSASKTSGTVSGMAEAVDISVTTPAEAGTYTATVTITAPGAADSPRTLNITLTVQDVAAALVVDRVFVQMESTHGGPNPAPVSVQVSNAGDAGTQFDWSVSIQYEGGSTGWLTATPSSGTVSDAPQSITLSADAVGQGLAAGTHRATLTIAAAGASGSPIQIPVTLLRIDGSYDFLFRDGFNGPIIDEVTLSRLSYATGTTSTSPRIHNQSSVAASLSGVVVSGPPAWLSRSISSSVSGGSQASATLTVSSQNLGGRVYYGLFKVTASWTDVPDYSVSRTLLIVFDVEAAPRLVLSPTSLSFSGGIAGESNPSPNVKTAQLSNTGDLSSLWTAEEFLTSGWLDCSPRSGLLNPGESVQIEVIADPLGSGRLASSYSRSILFNLEPVISNRHATLNISCSQLWRNLLVSITSSPQDPEAGQEIVFTVTIRNDGNTGSGPFRVGFWFDSPECPWPGTPPDENVDIDNLGASSNRTLTFTMIRSDQRTCRAWAVVDMNDQVVESSVIDNIADHFYGGDEYEVDNTLEDAKEILPGVYQARSIHVSSDLDYVKFYLNEPSLVAVEVDTITDIRVRVDGGTDTPVSAHTRLFYNLNAGWRSIQVNPSWLNHKVYHYGLLLTVGRYLIMTPESIVVRANQGEVSTFVARVKQTHSDSMPASISTDAYWLSALPSSILSLSVFDTDIKLTLNAGSLPVGTHHATVTVTSTEGANSPLVVPVTFVVEAPRVVTPLAFKVLDAEYTRQLDRIIAIASGVNELHIVDPLTAQSQIVPLSHEPQCVSVAPDGLTAAVGHPYRVSLIDLVEHTVIGVFTTPRPAADIVLAGNGFVYVSTYDGWGRLYSVDITSGAVSVHDGSSLYTGTRMRLHPNGRWICGANVGLSPSKIEKYDITRGAGILLYQWPYHGGGFEASGMVWPSDDGVRLFVRHGLVVTSHAAQQSDMRAIANLGIGIVEMAQSSLADSLLILRNSSRGRNIEPTSMLDLYRYSTLEHLSTNILPRRSGHPSLGRFVFFNAAADKHFVIVQAPEAAGLTNDWGIVVY